MTMSRINSYDISAARPLAGTLWVWEPQAAPALVKVTRVLWNGEEWWVETQSLADYGPFRQKLGVAWNDLSRFWEACHCVAASAGPPQTKGITRRGDPQPDELAVDSAPGA